jgi:hypothetical protein
LYVGIIPYFLRYVRAVPVSAYGFLVGKPEGKNHLEDLGVDGRII